MKNTFKLTYLLMLAVLLTTFSCSDDDNYQISVEDLVVDIDENPTNGQTVGTIQTDSTGDLTFSITSQTPTGALGIDESTGELTVADATLFDFETNTEIIATISVEGQGAVNTGTVTININDLDEVTAQNLTIAMDENPTDGEVVGSIQVNGGGTLSFSITSQTPADALNIDANTGELTVADPNLFDFEINPVITATIDVDNSINVSTATVTINLNDVDEIGVQDLTVDVDENPTNGQVLGTIQATSANTLTYTITYQSTAGAINIDQSTGELSVADATLFDFETTPTMFAVISVDNGVYSVNANANININNINELGDYSHGGVIFWVDPTDNSHGLVCALSNQMSAPWGCSGVVTGANGTAIGTGETNTATIISEGCATGSAAEVVSNLNLNGYDDWFLPSLDEFNEIAINYQTHIWPTIQANGGSALFGTVWTSSESNAVNAFIAYLGGSNPTAITKTIDVFNILPVRSF